MPHTVRRCGSTVEKTKLVGSTSIDWNGASGGTSKETTASESWPSVSLPSAATVRLPSAAPGTPNVNVYGAAATVAAEPAVTNSTDCSACPAAAKAVSVRLWPGATV